MLLDPVARVQVTKEQMDIELQKLITLFGSIEEGAYSHYVSLGSQSGMDTFQLVYQVKMSGQQFPKAVLLINLTAVGAETRVMGFRVQT